METATTPLPDLDRAEVVVPAPDAGPGNWAGAASAAVVDDLVYLTYRVRRPLTRAAASRPWWHARATACTSRAVSEVWRKEFGAESFERPVVLRTPDGTWRLYVSCATPDSKHWWIEAIDADRPEDFETGRRTVVLSGSDTIAVKDPVIVVDDQGGWHAWICEHPLTEAGHEDRMSTAYHRSDDGLGLGAARHRPGSAHRCVGRPWGARQRRGQPRPAGRALRRSAARRGQLARDDRCGASDHPE